MVRLGNATVEYGELRERQRPLLRFARDETRLTGMPLLTLLTRFVAANLERWRN